jgi:hypothetical protein
MIFNASPKPIFTAGLGVGNEISAVITYFHRRSVTWAGGENRITTAGL